MPSAARASLVLSLLFACNDRAVAPELPPAEPAEPVAIVTPTAVAPAPVRVAPATLPAHLAEPPAPTAALPDGTPTVEGRIDQLLALDDGAIVRFLVPGLDHAKLWWLARMRPDGSLVWVRPLSGTVAENEDREPIVRTGDTVSIATFEIVGDDPRVTLHGLALADGAPRFTSELGPGFITNTVADERARYDTRVHYKMTGGVVAELTATTAAGVAWRAAIGSPIPVGHDPTPVRDVVAVRTEDRGLRETRWLVFDAATGDRRGELLAEPQSCSDGQRWFVRGKDALLEVDTTTVTARPVFSPPVLPGANGPWVLEDCSFAGGAPVVLVARGQRKALVALDPTSLAIAGHIELGATSVGLNGFDPLPTRNHRAMVLRTLSGEAEELVIADPAAGRLVARWRSRAQYGGFSLSAWWAGGALLTIGDTIATIPGDTGELQGRARLPEPRVEPGQIFGDTLWLPPREPLLLGRRAPYVVSLTAPVADDMRDAVLADAITAEAATAGAKAPPCPDPRAVVRGDGIGGDPHPPALAPSRLPAWDLEILDETARALACAPASAPTRLLAWYVIEDDRPLRNDNALLLVENTTVDPPRFSLVSVYRHATNHEWNTIGSFHDRREPVRTLDHRPTRAELDAFIEQSGWSFVDSWGKIIAGNVIDEHWRAATGEAPWHGFPRGVEQPD